MTSAARARIGAAQLANSELLVDSRLARADLETTETISRHAAGRVVPQLRVRQTTSLLAFISSTRSRPSVVDWDANMNGCPDLRRDTCHEAR